MGRRRNKQHQDEDSSETVMDDEETITESEYTDSVQMEEEEEVEEEEIDTIQILVDNTVELFDNGLTDMTESRATTRIKGIKAVLEALRSGVNITERVMTAQDQLEDDLPRMLRKAASSTEFNLLCELISLLSLVYGPENGEYYEKFSSSLRHTAVRGDKVDARCTALRSLCFTGWCCSKVDTRDAWEVCESLLNNTCDFDENEENDIPNDVLVEACRCWSLLATALPAEDVLEKCEEGTFESVSSVLHQGTTAAIIAGSRTIGVMLEAAAVTQPDADPIGLTRIVCYDNSAVDRVHSELKRIYKDSSKRVSKEDRRLRRAAVRSTLDMLEEGHHGDEEVELLDASVWLDSFRQEVAYDGLSSVLQGGMQASYLVFPVVSDLLDLEEGIRDKVDKNSNYAKNRCKNRAQERKYKSAKHEVVQ